VAAQNREGAGFVVWEDDSSGWLVGARVSDGDVGEITNLVEAAVIPGIAVDENGALHLSWIEPMAIKYAVFGPGELESKEGVAVARLEELSVNTIDGPTINIADNQVYIAWSIFANVGLESGSGWTEYVSFPAGAPAATTSTRLWILPDEEQPYDPYKGSYQLTVLADPVTSPMLTTSIVLEPNASGSRGSELAMVVSAMQNQRLDEYVQMVLVLFEEGQFKGYQLAGKTESLSREGVLTTDDTGNLHLVWREGTGIKVYYATTAPNIQSGIDRLGGEDFASIVLGGGLEAVTGAMFFPLSLIWFIPGFAILGIYKLWRDDETMSDRLSQFLAVIAVINYQLSKVFFMPTIISYVPFSAWLETPDSMNISMQVSVPVIILAVGIVVAEIVRRRRPMTSALIYFLVLCGTDALLTLAIYGVVYLGYF
jgi:hypothetical protein